MGTDKHQTDGDGTCCTCVDHSYSSGSYEPAAADFPVTTARRGGGPSQWHAGRAFTAAAMPLRFIVIMATFRRADAGTRDPIGSVLYRYEVLSNFSDLKRSRGQLLVLRKPFMHRIRGYRGQDGDRASETCAVPLEYQQADLMANFDYRIFRWPGGAGPNCHFFRGPLFAQVLTAAEGNPRNGPGQQAEPIRYRTYMCSPQFIAFVGAAQVFGRGVITPFPEIVSRKLNTPWLNFGIGGVGVHHFHDPFFVRKLSRAAVVVINSMSGRSVNVRTEDGLEYNNDGGAMFWDPRRNTSMLYWKDVFFRRVRPEKEARSHVIRYVRNQLIADYGKLRSLIEAEAKAIGKTPPRLIYTTFHNRDVNVSHGYEEAADAFPQYVDAKTQQEISKLFPTTVNGTNTTAIGYKAYYPSEEHHRQFSERLLPTLQHELDASMASHAAACLA